MRRVLMITACWPPSTRVGARRPVRLARRLPALGWEPVILTVDEAEAYPTPRDADHSLAPPPVEVHRVSARYPSVRLERGLHRVFGRWPRLDRIARVLLRDWRLPDQFVEWTFAAVARARALGHFDAVWVTGAPFGLFVPGVAVGRALGAPVVFDYRDPWTTDLPPATHPFGIPPVVRGRLEVALLGQAAGVSFVNQAMYDAYQLSIGQRPDQPWAVIPNGFDPLDAPDVPPVENPRPVLLYAGSCYGSRSMLPVLEALHAGFGPGDAGLCLRVFGALDPAAAAFLAAHPLPGRVEVCDRIPSAEVFAQMRGAAALLLIVGEGHRTALTAKIFDYLMTARPILGIGPADAAARDLIERCGVGGWASEGAALVAALRRVEAGDLPFAPRPEAIRAWSADGMALATARLLEAVDRSA